MTEKPATTRRSSRRHQSAVQSPATPAAPVNPATPEQTREAVQTMLECNDEMQLASEGRPDDSTALHAFVDDLEDEMDGEQAQEPFTAETASFDKMEKENSHEDEMRKSDSCLNSRNANSSKHGEPPRSNSICNKISLEDLHRGRACMIMFRSQTWEVVRRVHWSLSLFRHCVYFTGFSEPFWAIRSKYGFL